MVKRALSYVVKGVPAFAKNKKIQVFTISIDPSGFLTSQVHPEPKLLTAILLNCSLKPSTEPH